MSREAAVLLARKLKALAEHEGTPEAEASNARDKLTVLVRRWELSPDELVEPQSPLGMPPMSPEWQAWSAKAQAVINNDGEIDMKGLRDLVDDLPDPEMRRKVRMMFNVAQFALDLWRW